ncbi:MAG: redox-regulated ATPase YchF [Parachlamydiales bacterium]|nr:redox-regulated ATPase YchF [Parachlamydiales bacterium]
MTHLSCGIVGLPNVGKSTLFNALTKKGVAAENYPFCTIDPNVGVVAVPDPRLETLAQLSHSQKIVPAAVTFVDIAGLVKGAAEGEGLGNQFLKNIRETDVILHVVRCFENEGVIHVQGKIDPVADIEIINIELILADLQMAQNIYAKLEKQIKHDKGLLLSHHLLQRIIDHCNKNLAIRSMSLSKEEQECLRQYPFLTAKKVLYVANTTEEESFKNIHVKKVQELATQENSIVIPLCVQLENEIAALEPEEAKQFLQEIGRNESGLDLLIRESFRALNLITFITTGEMETKAWTIFQGSTALDAAAKIHTDIQKGFIRAEVVSYNDMIAYKGRVGAREVGKARSEGKNYIVHDGDVILFYHN